MQNCVEEFILHRDKCEDGFKFRSAPASVSVIISQKICITLISKCAHKNLRDKL